MGTRADFYVGHGKNAEWLGSQRYDGFPERLPNDLVMAATEDHYRKAVAGHLASLGHGILPRCGWPWPWGGSSMTNVAYAFDGGEVWAAIFGYGWYPADDLPEDRDSQTCRTIENRHRRVVFRLHARRLAVY